MPLCNLAHGSIKPNAARRVGIRVWRSSALGLLFVLTAYARSVVYRGHIYVVGESTTAGSVHSTAGSKVVETYIPG